MHLASVANVQALVNDLSGMMVFLRSLIFQRIMDSLGCDATKDYDPLCHNTSCSTLQMSLESRYYRPCHPNSADLGTNWLLPPYLIE